MSQLFKWMEGNDDLNVAVMLGYNLMHVKIMVPEPSKHFTFNIPRRLLVFKIVLLVCCLAFGIYAYRPMLVEGFKCANHFHFVSSLIELFSF